MSSDVTRYDQATCNSLDRALQLEWLETNGIGGFASSSIVGLNTRRYHGLLIAATKPPVGRMVLLSKLEETLIIGDERYDLSANQYPGVVHPQGYRYLREFRLDPFPTFMYEVNGIEIEKHVFMVHGENTTVIEYGLRTVGGAVPSKCVLELRPLIAFRDYHSTTHRNDAIDPTVGFTNGLASITPYRDLPTLYFAHNAAEWATSSNWYVNLEYAVERERGLDYTEDLFNPFVLRFQFGGQATATVIASMDPTAVANAGGLKHAEIARRREVLERAPIAEPMIQHLTAAAEQFIVRRGNLHTILAGYHWFTDWGRDTMISLAGLTLATGRANVARDILRAFAESVDEGMLPNRFPDAGDAPEYNTVDATLWFFEAVRSYLRYTGDYAFVSHHLYRKLKDIISWHLSGTRYRIRVDEDGLLHAGEPGVQLTWMDAKIGDWVVTPRTGKPVEIQALWYNALRVMENLAGFFHDAGPKTFVGALATKAQESFNTLFWNEEAGCLYDVVDGHQKDGAIRPNQIFAVSLTHGVLSPERARKVVDVVQRELFTPVGLRSLSPRDSRYCGRYEGDARQRDSAYHQGTVWPWLMGPFITAYLKVNGRSDEARKQTATWLDAFRECMTRYGLGQISEVADGDFPHKPGGCIAQAWSVGELLRAAVEHVYDINSREVRTERARERDDRTRA